MNKKMLILESSLRNVTVISRIVLCQRPDSEFYSDNSKDYLAHALRCKLESRLQWSTTMSWTVFWVNSRSHVMLA